MANIVVPNAAEQLQLKNILNHTSPQNQVLKLFCNNFTPGASDTESSFTEAAGGGYASKSLTGSSWTIATDGSGNASGSYAIQTWTFTGALTTNTTIYGYYVVQSSSGLLLWCQLAPAAVTPTTNGDTFSITPIVTHRQQP